MTCAPNIHIDFFASNNDLQNNVKRNKLPDSDIIVTIRILPGLEKYYSSLGNGVHSRSWGKHYGQSICVEKVMLVPRVSSDPVQTPQKTDEISAQKDVFPLRHFHPNKITMLFSQIDGEIFFKYSPEMIDKWPLCVLSNISNDLLNQSELKIRSSGKKLVDQSSPHAKLKASNSGHAKGLALSSLLDFSNLPYWCVWLMCRVLILENNYPNRYVVSMEDYKRSRVHDARYQITRLFPQTKKTQLNKGTKNLLNPLDGELIYSGLTRNNIIWDARGLLINGTDVIAVTNFVWKPISKLSND